MNLKQAEAHKDYMHPEWYELLKPVLGGPELEEVYAELSKIRENYGKEIYPNQEKIWRCFRDFGPRSLRSVVLGQDPYHTPGVATGLSFAVGQASYVPPSLRNILREIVECNGGTETLSQATAIERNDYRAVWGEHQAKQGVLLLNAALTVRRGQPGSHSKLWAPVIGRILELIAQNTTQVVWLSLGSNAADLYENYVKDNIGENQHPEVRTTHPSPFSWDRDSSKAPAFKDSHCFNKVNEHLETFNKPKINW